MGIPCWVEADSDGFVHVGQSFESWMILPLDWPFPLHWPSQAQASNIVDGFLSSHNYNVNFKMSSELAHL